MQIIHPPFRKRRKGRFPFPCFSGFQLPFFPAMLDDFGNCLVIVLVKRDKQISLILKSVRMITLLSKIFHRIRINIRWEIRFTAIAIIMPCKRTDFLIKVEVQQQAVELITHKFSQIYVPGTLLDFLHYSRIPVQKFLAHSAVFDTPTQINCQMVIGCSFIHL